MTEKPPTETPPVIKLKRWTHNTSIELRALLSRQVDFDKWRKMSGFHATLLKPEILAGVAVYGLQREYDQIVKKYNPPKTKRKQRQHAKPNDTAPPTFAPHFTASPQAPPSNKDAKLDAVLSEFDAAMTLVTEMNRNVIAAVQKPALLEVTMSQFHAAISLLIEMSLGVMAAAKPKPYPRSK
jgi:hypothetical protein